MKNSTALRMRSTRPVTLSEKLACCLHGFSQLIGGLFLSLYKPFCSIGRSMCKYYGHIIDHRVSYKGFPKCADCGIVINSPKMLRTADPRSAKEIAASSEEAKNL